MPAVSTDSSTPAQRYITKSVQLEMVEFTR
jgi:hypothetical protein